jgi:calcium-dependent protein kinase
MAALTAIAVQVSPADIRDVKEMFQILDKNGDGSLTIKEIEDGFKELNINDREQLLENIKLADVNNSGEIDYTEFIAATLDHKILSNEKNLKAAFDMFDQDGSGSIDKSEIIKILTNTDEGSPVQKIATEKAINDAIKQIDINGDGKIDFKEFKEMMKNACHCH